MKYSMNLMTANPFSPSPGTTATAQFQKQPLLQTSPIKFVCSGIFRYNLRQPIQNKLLQH